MSENQYMTVLEIAAELRVPRSTVYYWRQKGIGPRAIKLPNGDVRVRRTDFEAWLKEHEEVAAA